MSACSSSSDDREVPHTPVAREKAQVHIQGQLPLPALDLPTPPATQHRKFCTDGLLPTASTATRPPIQPFVNRLNGGILRGTGLGIGLGRNNLPRRLRNRQKDNLESCFSKYCSSSRDICVAKPAIRRLARRGGIKRIKSEIYDSIQEIIKNRLNEILRVTCAITDLAERKTVTSLDVIYALKRLGTPLYGFGHIEDRGPESRAKEQRKKRAEAMAEKERARQRDEGIRWTGGLVRVPARARAGVGRSMDGSGDGGEVLPSVEE